jgi:tyrosine-protein kinase Etk/Wzc
MMAQNTQKNSAVEQDDEIDLIAIAKILWAKKWIVLAFTFVGLLVGFFLMRWMRDVYSSDALLQLDVSSSKTSAMVDIGSIFEQESPAEAEIRLIKSRHVLMEVVTKENLNYSSSPIGFWNRLARKEGRMELSLFKIPNAVVTEEYEWIVEALTPTTFKLNSPLGGTLIEGSVGNTYREPFAGDTVAICISMMLAEPGQQFKLASSSVLEVAESLKEILNVAEDGKKTNILTLSLENRYPDKAASILNAIIETYVRQNVEMRSAEAEKTLEFLEEQLPSIKAKLDSSESVLTNYRHKVGTVDLTAEAKVTLDRQVHLKAQLLNVEQQIQENARLYTEDHPTMQAILQQQTRLKREIAKEEALVKDLPTTQQEVIKLQQEVQINNELYSSILNNIQQLRVVRAGEIGNVRIVDKACIRAKPIKPRRKIILLGGMLGGFLLGCGLIFLQRMMYGNGVTSASEIERETNVSVFSKIAKTRMDNIPSYRERLFCLAAVAPENLSVEQLRLLRSALEFSFLDAGNKVLLVSGISPGAGKSFVSMNLAYLFAMMGKKVLLVDADLRKSRLSEKKAAGLSDILCGKSNLEDVVDKVCDGAFEFLPIGKRNNNPNELLSSKNFEEFIKHSKESYDVVLVDTPPINLVADAQSIARYVDFALLVLRYRMDSMENIKEALAALDIAGVQKRAFVLNQCYNDGSFQSYGYYKKYK